LWEHKNSQKRITKTTAWIAIRPNESAKAEAYEITKRIMRGKPVTALQKMDKDAQTKY